MLTTTKSITLTGKSTIDGVVAQSYSATISNTNPEEMTLSGYQTNKATYKANRAVCRQDSADFEDLAYALQDELIAANSNTSTTGGEEE